MTEILCMIAYTIITIAVVLFLVFIVAGLPIIAIFFILNREYLPGIMFAVGWVILVSYFYLIIFCQDCLF